MSVSMSRVSGSPLDPFRSGKAPGTGDAIRSLLALLWIEIRRGQGIWLVPLMVIPGLFLGNDYYENVVLWPIMSDSIMRSHIVIGPLSAALAAWLVDRDRRRNTRGLIETMATGPFQRDIVLLTTATFWGLVSYAQVALWYGFQGVTEATWGGPDLTLIAVGILGVLILTGAGFIIGRIVHGKFSPILAAAAAFFVSVAPTVVESYTQRGISDLSRPPIQALTPWGLAGSDRPTVFEGYPSGYLTGGALWLAGVAAVTITAIALMRMRKNRLAWVALAISCVVALSGADRVLGYDRVRMSEEDRRVPFTWSCKTTIATEVCVHPAYEPVLDESAHRINNFFAPVAGLAGVPARWEQYSRADQSDVALFSAGQRYDYGYELATALFDRHEFTAAQSVILIWLSGRVDPESRNFGLLPYPVELVGTPSLDAEGGMIGYEFDQEAGASFAREVPAAADRFAVLSPEAQRAWLEANWDALRAGELTLEDLP